MMVKWIALPMLLPAAVDGGFEICHNPIAGEEHGFEAAPDPGG